MKFVMVGAEIQNNSMCMSITFTFVLIEAEGQNLWKVMAKMQICLLISIVLNFYISSIITKPLLMDL